MDDLISREQAIKSICEDGTWLERQGCVDITMAERKQRDVDILESLPSAQKTGHWIPWKAYYGKDRKSWSDELKCSECNYKWGDEEYRFCPNCGAKMMEE